MRYKGLLTACLISAVVFGAVAPTLRWIQFGDPIENLNVATAMEIRRGGSWLLPTLQGVPRLAKPPLTAWLTAAALRPSSLSRIGSPEPAVRADGYDRLAFDVRWPALLAMCLMLAAVYGLGQTLGSDENGPGCGHTLGWTAAVICGSTFLFLRQCRLATTDAQLALWVSVANLCLARIVFRRERWCGGLGAGAALGLALMSKGPIATVQTVLPFGAFAVWKCVVRPPPAVSATEPRPRRLLAPLAAGASVMLLIGLSWYALIALRLRGAGSLWWAEATRIGADGPPSRAPWFKYASSLYLFLPWLVWLTAGAYHGIGGLRGRRGTPGGHSWSASEPAILALFMLALPLLAMSFSRDRFERYLTPMTPAAALLAACGLAQLRATQGAHLPGHLARLHWMLLGAILIGLPVVAAARSTPSWRTSDGRPWVTPGGAAFCAVAGVIIVCIGGYASRRWPGAIVAVTGVAMLAGEALYASRRGESASSQSTLRPVADVILSRYPDAEIYAYRPPWSNVISVPANDLSIHLNRTIRWASDLSAIERSGRPQVFVIYRVKNPGAAAPSPPPDWTVLARPRAGGAEDRYVFVR